MPLLLWRDHAGTTLARAAPHRSSIPAPAATFTTPGGTPESSRHFDLRAAAAGLQDGARAFRHPARAGGDGVERRAVRGQAQVGFLVELGHERRERSRGGARLARDRHQRQVVPVADSVCAGGRPCPAAIGLPRSSSTASSQQPPSFRAFQKSSGFTSFTGRRFAVGIGEQRPAAGLVNGVGALAQGIAGRQSRKTAR